MASCKNYLRYAALAGLTLSGLAAADHRGQVKFNISLTREASVVAEQSQLQTVGDEAP